MHETEERFPLWTLVRAARVVERLLHAAIAEAGLTPTQFGVLRYLADDGELTQAELARNVLVRPQSMGELVGSLLERGLVRRAGPGGRGRRTGLVLTGAGRALADAAMPGVRACHAPATIGLTTEQAATLDDLLLRMLHAMGAS